MAALLNSKTVAQLAAAGRSNVRAARFKPFVQVQRSTVARRAPVSLVRAAEPETEAAPVDEFEFNFSDAKKGNEYSQAEVNAALEGATNDYNAEHIENEFAEGGFEDASFFDEIDNNEAYDDEFIAAGIPEAAPKQRRGAKPGDAEEEAEGDDISAAKEASRLREIEEQMVLEAELQESGLDQLDSAPTTTVGPAVWDWMGDVDVTEEDDDRLMAMARNPARISAAVAEMLPSDEAVFASLRGTTLEDVSEETRDTIDFLLDDFDLESELKAIPEGDADEELVLPEDVPLDTAAIDALLKEDISLPDIDASLLTLAELPVVEDDGLDLEEGVVSKYVEEISGVQGSAMTDDEVKAMFAGGEPAQLLSFGDEAPITVDDADLAVPADNIMLDMDLPAALEDNFEDIDDVTDYVADIQSLAVAPVPEFTMPTEEEFEVLDQYLTASEQLLASEEERKMAIAQAVARGELPTDALDADDYIDAESDLLAATVADIEDDGAFDDEDEDDGENWQERIIELNRVTKVVKGGKLMGFRCTAIVGNGKGLVGVGCQSGREVATAVKRALVDAKKSVVRVPLVGAGTIPHRVEAKFHAARCVVVPAADGTGCLAGGSIRSVLELAGVQNVLGKRLGCRSALNNARCTVAALEQLRTLQDVSKARGVPMSRLLLPQ